MGLPLKKYSSNTFAVEKSHDATDVNHIGNRLFFIAMILTIIGFLFIVDTSLVFKGKFDTALMLTKIVKAAGLIVIGWMSAFYLSRLDRRSLQVFGSALLLASLAMLFMVKYTALGVERNHCRRWLEIGPLTIQPLEFFKLALVLQIASFLSTYGSLERLKIIDVIKPGVPVVIGLYLISVQPNLSAVVFIALICGVLAWIGGLPTRRLAYLVGFFSLVFLVLMLIHHDRWGRIISLLNLSGSISGAGYQVGMGLHAIARGGLFGVGIGESIGKFALPYNDSDFIFSVIVEETGFLGGLLIIGLFAMLVYYIVKLASTRKDNYSLLVCLGIGLVIAAQAGINIAVNLGLVPTTGMPLPFISAGGSNFVATLFAVGILLNLAGGPASQAEAVKE